MLSEGLVRRRKKAVATEDEEDINSGYNDRSNASDLTLMEEILLLGLKNREGYIPLSNDWISPGLRGCVLIELALRNRIELERAGMRKKNLISRSIILKSDAPIGDVILDETLKHIKETQPPQSVLTWIRRLSGETWNPLMLRYQLRNVRKRLAKNLVDKGVLRSKKLNFFVFDMITHPLRDSDTKARLIMQLRESVLQRWTNDVHRMDKRILSLIILAHASDVLENVFAPLSDQHYELAKKRIRSLLALDFEAEAEKKPDAKNLAVMWAVFEVFNKREINILL